ncbi:hypothetical protein [Mucilaginibacter polytrichastri]|nr:hypothetical protein [Mucilaginibacter polytrichastri]SFT27586.1 hypothetical protein SAMN04487890_1312 [Mucilaginibacter polytrichastri]
MELYQQIFGELNTNIKSNFNAQGTTLSLFKDDNENGGIFIKADFVPDLKAAGNLHPAFIVHAKKLVDNMYAKLPFAVEPNEGFENGMSVTWCRFKDGNLKATLCVPNIKGMAELINSYRHDKIVVNVDFEGLLKQIQETTI